MNGLVAGCCGGGGVAQAEIRNTPKTAAYKWPQFLFPYQLVRQNVNSLIKCVHLA